MASGQQQQQQRYRQHPHNQPTITMMDQDFQIDNSILSGATSGSGIGNISRLSYGDVDQDYEYDYGDFERSPSGGIDGGVMNWMNLTTDTGTPNSISRRSIPSHPLFGHLGHSMDDNDDFERRFNEAPNNDDDESATSFDSSSSRSQSTGESTTKADFWDSLMGQRDTESFNTTFDYTDDGGEEDVTVSTGSLEDKRKESSASANAGTTNSSSFSSRLFNAVGGGTSYLDRPVQTQTPSLPNVRERDAKQQSSITACRLPLSSVLSTTTTAASCNKDVTAASDCSRPFDESMLDLGRQILKQDRFKPAPPPPPPALPLKRTSSQRQREPPGSKSIDGTTNYNGNNTAAPLDELQDDAKAKQQQQRRSTKTREQQQPSSTHKKKNGSRGPGLLGDNDQLLCVYICVDPHCPHGTQCQPPDILREAKNMNKTIRDPSFFYVPVSLILRREADMRQAAKQTKVPKNRWNGSLLYRKWQEIEAVQQQQRRRRHDNKQNIEDDSTSTGGFVKILNCALHPVKDLAQAHVVSPKFPWWQSWLTVCIRAYYNTGTVRIPKHCHGLEILLALEFFGILYASPDNLIFDDPAVYQKVKQWSRYFTHRASLAKWVVDTLKEKQLEEQRHQQQGNNDNNKMKYPGPFVFCTHPKSVKPDWHFTIEPLQKSIIIFEGGLQLEDPNDIGSSSKKKHRRKKRSSSHPTSEQLVHEFFVPPNPKDGSHVENEGVDDAVFSSPEVVPGMMREDFKSYLQHVLPDLELTFAIKEIQLVSNHLVMGRNKKKVHGDFIRRAVLVVSFSPHPAMSQHNKPPQNGVIQKTGDPKGRPQAAKDEGKMPPIRPAVSYESTDSISNAPTDEMAFGKLLETTHKAVTSLLERTANEKLTGDRGRQEEFYFHKQEANNTDKKVSTPDTTGSSEVSLMLEEPPVPSKSQTASAPNVLFPMSRVQDKHTDGKQGGLPEPTAKDHGMPKPSKLKKQHSNVGYGPCALDTSHIYGGELFLDSIFSHPATPNQNIDMKRTGTSVSQQSPLWTPSLEAKEGFGEETTPDPAPLPFVNASTPDHESVASSITRQPESVATCKVNQQDSLLSDSLLSENPIDAPAAKDNETAKSTPDRNSTALTCGTVEDLYKSLDADDVSGVKKLHDESFEARFDAFMMSDDCGPYKTGIPKPKKEKRMKKNLQAALDDLKFGLSAKDLEEIREAASGEKADVASCQFLTDMIEIFLPSPKPPSSKRSRRSKRSTMGCDDGTSSSKPSRRSKGSTPDTTLDSATLDSEEGSTFTWTRKKRYPVAEAIGAHATEENPATAALLMQLFSKQKAPMVPNELSSPERKASPSATNVKKKPIVPSAREAIDADDNSNNGIEVYHIPQVAPTPGAQRLTRKAPMPPKGGGRGRTHPPRNPMSKPSSTAVPPRGGKPSTTKQRDAPSKKGEKKKSKGLFGFLRKK